MTRYSSTMRDALAKIRGGNLHEAPEDNMPASPDEGGMAIDQLKFMAYAANKIMQHIQSGGEFPEWMQNKLSGTHEKMKSLYANIEHDDMNEAVLANRDYKVKDGKVHISMANFKKVSKDYKNDTRGKERMVVLDPKTQATVSMPVVFEEVDLEEGAFSELQIVAKDLAKYAAKDKKGMDYKDFMKAAAMMKTGKVKELSKFTMDLDTEPRDKIIDMVKSAVGKDAAEKIFNVTFREGKSSTGYELYHKDFSSAMKHAYDFAKKKFGIEVDPKEIDDKVASGPRKPSKGKTNSYRLMGKDGKKAIQVQVYGMDNGKYELNMYKESMDLEESFDLDEMKMDDPKLVKAFDKLKRGDTIKLKTSSTISKGTDFVDYVVKAKNTVNKGRVEKVTLATKGNEGAVKKFLYKRDGKVTFAIGDMGASIDDIKEGVEPIQWPSQPLEEKLKVSDGLGAWIDDFKKSDAPQFAGKSDEEKKNMAIAAFTDAGGKLDESVLNELREPYTVIDTADGNKVVGMASDEKGAKSIITTSELPPMKIKDKKTLKIVKVKKKQMIGQPIKEEEEPEKSDGAKAVDQMRDDKKKTRIAQLQLQIAKAQETINKINAQEKPSE